jgi:transcriptional regulator with XRE-family HTH domain
MKSDIVMGRNMHLNHIYVKDEYAPRDVLMRGGGAYTCPMRTQAPHHTRRRHHYFREWRMYRRLTQAQAAERAGVDQSTLSRLENAKIQYEERTLEALAFAYDCEPHELLTVNPTKDGDVIDISDLLKSADESQRRQAKALIEALLKTSA